MNRTAQLGLWLFNIFVLLIGLFVLPTQIQAVQNPLNSKCSVSFTNARANYGNLNYFQTNDEARGDYKGNNGHVRLFVANIDGAPLSASLPSVTANYSCQGVDSAKVTECSTGGSVNEPCYGDLPFSLSAMPGGKYIAYCDVWIFSGPYAGAQCTGNPFCNYAQNNGLTSKRYWQPSLCTDPSPVAGDICTNPNTGTGHDTPYCAGVSAGEAPVKVVAVSPYIMDIARSCAGPNNPAFTITTSAKGNFQQMRILSNGFNVTPGGFNGGTYSGSGYTNATNYNFQVEGLAGDGTWVSSSAIDGGATMQAYDCTPAVTPTISVLANSCSGPNQPNLAFFWSSAGATRYYLQVWSTTRGLIHDGYYNYNNYSPPNQTNNEGFYVRVYGIKNVGGSDIWTTNSDYGTVYNQNCAPAAQPTVIVSSNVCTNANSPALTFSWSSAGASQYYIQAWSSTRGILVDGITTSTSYTAPNQTNNEGLYMRVYAGSPSGGWSAFQDHGTVYAYNCAQPGTPSLTQTPVCGGPTGTQSQINFNWTAGNLMQEFWTYDDVAGWVMTTNSTKNYTLNTTPGATYQIMAANRRYVPNNVGGEHLIQTYQNNAYVTVNRNTGAAVSNVGTPATMTSIAGPDCSPPGNFNASFTTSSNAECSATGAPSVTISWTPSTGATLYRITRTGPGGTQTFTDNASPYVDATVARGQTYNYSVVAYRTLFDGRVVSTNATPPTLTVNTAWCDTQPPQILGVSTPAGGCYDRFNWSSNNVFRVRAQDLPTGASGIANVSVRLVKATAPISQTDYTTTYDAGNDVYATNPINLTIGNSYNEYQVWVKADDRVNPTNSTGWVQMFPPTNTPYYFYTQPSCAAPFVQTNQGSVHSNQGINVPTPGPTAAPTRRGGPSPI